MLNHPEFKQIRHELQGNYHYFYQLCQSLYQRYCPRCVTQRRNVAHVKIDDCRLLAATVFTNNAWYPITTPFLALDDRLYAAKNHH